jgi:hypothetical protein
MRDKHEKPNKLCFLRVADHMLDPERASEIAGETTKDAIREITRTPVDPRVSVYRAASSFPPCSKLIYRWP